MEKKTYYCVTNTLTDKRAFACITDVAEATERPEGNVVETTSRTVYTDWLTREEIASTFPRLHYNYFELLSSFAVEV